MRGRKRQQHRNGGRVRKLPIGRLLRHYPDAAIDGFAAIMLARNNFDPVPRPDATDIPRNLMMRPEALDVSGKVVLIAGAGRGISNGNAMAAQTRRLSYYAIS